MTVMPTAVNRQQPLARNLLLGGNGLPVAAAPTAPITNNTTITAAPVQQQQQASAPPTGLIGAEAAILGGTSGALNSLNSSTAQSVGGLYSMMGQLTPSQQQVNIPVAPTVQSAPLGAITAPAAATAPSVRGANMAGINAAFNQADAAVSGYNQGEGALKMQADLSGANGPQAQQAAYAAYQSSPAMQYQMDQMQKATERSAAARGGLMSGAVLQELQRSASGIASQDYQNQFANLGQVAQTGLAAAGQQAQNRAQQATTAAGLQGQELAGRYSLAGQQMAGQNAINSAQLQGQYGLLGQQYGAQNAVDLAQLQGQYGIAGQQLQNQAAAQQQATGIKANLASQIADITSGSGLNAAMLQTQTGQQLAQGRTQAGQAIAQNATQAASSIAQLLNQQGIGVSDMMSKDISSITDMIYQSGMQDKVDMQNLAALIANINSGQASTMMQGQQSIGAAQAAGILGAGNAAQQGVQQGIATGLIGGK